LAELFINFCHSEFIDIIIPLDSSIVVSCIPYLRNIRVVHILNSDSQRLYKYVTSYLETVSKIICISARQVNVLKERLHEPVFLEKVALIPHGVLNAPNNNIQKHFAP